MKTRAQAAPTTPAEESEAAELPQSLFVEERAATQQRSSNTSDRAQRRHLEAEREAEAVELYRTLTIQKARVFEAGWWRHEHEMSGRPSRVPFGVNETQDERIARFTAVRDWLDSAENLIEMFCYTKQLYTSDRTKKFTGVIRTKTKRGDALDRQARAMMLRLGEGGAPIHVTVESRDFRGIELDDWTKLVMEVSFIKLRPTLIRLRQLTLFILPPLPVRICIDESRRL